MKAKEFLKEVLAGRATGRVPCVPLVFTFCSQLRGLSPREMLSDPTLCANSLQDGYELFGYDAVVTYFDTTLEAEACGCDLDWTGGLPRVASHPLAEGRARVGVDADSIETGGRVPVAMEVARRLSGILGRDCGLIGTVTGPLTLFRHLVGTSFGEAREGDAREAEELLEVCGTVAGRMARLYGEAGLDAILVAEDVPSSELEGELSGLSAVYDSQWGIARYFDATPLFLAGEYPAGETAAFLDMIGADCVIAGEGPIIDAARESGMAFGAGVPAGILSGPTEQIERTVVETAERSAGGGFFLSTGWEVPPGAPVENLHAFIKAARQVSIEEER